MKYLPLYFLLLLTGAAVYAVNLPPVPAAPVNNDLISLEKKEESKTSFVEKQLIYRQIYNMAFDNISMIVDDNKLKAKTWAAVFSYRALVSEATHVFGQPITESAISGAKDLSCNIEGLGGRVIIISNYSEEESLGLSQLAQLRATESELKAMKFCYSSLIVPNTPDATNKNPRFTAVTSGDYESVITTVKLPPLKIIAYFGTKFEDFPNFKANVADKISPDSSEFEPFGYNYFLLPDFQLSK